MTQSHKKDGVPRESLSQASTTATIKYRCHKYRYKNMNYAPRKSHIQSATTKYSCHKYLCKNKNCVLMKSHSQAATTKYSGHKYHCKIKNCALKKSHSQSTMAATTKYHCHKYCCQNKNCYHKQSRWCNKNCEPQPNNHSQENLPVEPPPQQRCAERVDLLPKQERCAERGKAQVWQQTAKPSNTPVQQLMPKSRETTAHPVMPQFIQQCHSPSREAIACSLMP